MPLEIPHRKLKYETSPSLSSFVEPELQMISMSTIRKRQSNLSAVVWGRGNVPKRSAHDIHCTGSMMNFDFISRLSRILPYKSWCQVDHTRTDLIAFDGNLSEMNIFASPWKVSGTNKSKVEVILDWKRPSQLLRFRVWNNIELLEELLVCCFSWNFGYGFHFKSTNTE